MADGRTIAGVGLIAAAVVSWLVERSASADEPPRGGGPVDPPPATNFEPVVFGDPQFEITLVD